MKEYCHRNTWTGWEPPQRGFTCEIKGTRWGFRPASITGMKVDLIFPVSAERSDCPEDKEPRPNESQVGQRPKTDSMILWISRNDCELFVTPEKGANLNHPETFEWPLIFIWCQLEGIF